MKLTEQQINKINNYIDAFKTNSELYEAFDNNKIIERLQALDYDTTAKNFKPEYTDEATAFFHSFCGFFNETLEKDVIPAAAATTKREFGISEKAAFAYEELMNNIFHQMPEELVDGMEKLPIDDEAYDTFIEEAFERNKGLFMDEPEYKTMATKIQNEKKVSSSKTESAEENYVIDQLVDFPEKVNKYLGNPDTDYRKFSQTYRDYAHSVSLYYMTAKEDYKNMSFGEKWFSWKGLTMGWKLLQVRRSLNRMNDYCKDVFKTPASFSAGNPEEVMMEESKNDLNQNADANMSEVKSNLRRTQAVPASELEEDDEVNQDFGEGNPEPEDDLEITAR